jgi:Tfp pilus assembly protein PilX
LIFATLTDAQRQQKLEEFFQSMRGNAETQQGSSHLWVVLLLAIALAALVFAIHHYNNRNKRVVGLNNARALQREVARAAGLRRRELRVLTQQAKTAGIDHALVAAICPSITEKR